VIPFVRFFQLKPFAGNSATVVFGTNAFRFPELLAAETARKAFENGACKESPLVMEFRMLGRNDVN
jgi:hypothetical protein